MLQVGLTGGIGSGKSAVARLLVGRGAVLIDADVLAREAVEPGTDGLAEVVAEFGTAVLGPDGRLDRPALASRIFDDPAARERLNAIIHPLVRRRGEELVAAAPSGAIVVQDIPLLVEGAMGPRFQLVVVVHADEAERLRRLVSLRGMAEADALARIAAQADDQQRRAAADVWLDNTGEPADLGKLVDELWERRLVPFAENLMARRQAPLPSADPVAPDPDWALAGARLAARVSRAVPGGIPVEHVGDTAVPGRPARDVIELLAGVPDGAVATVRDALPGAGFVPGSGDHRTGDHGPVAHQEGQEFGSADPGRPAVLRVVRRDSLERAASGASPGNGSAR